MVSNNNQVATISQIDKMIAEIPNINTIPEARKLLAIAQGVAVSAHKLYKTTDITTIADGQVDKDKAFDIAKKSAELRLRVEARIGELIKSEQAAGRLAHGGDRQGNNIVTLKDYGLTKIESSRAQSLAENKELIAKVIVESIDIPTRNAVLKEIKEISYKENRKDKIERDLPEGIFNVIYGDAPWKYDNSGFAMSSNKHYEVMDLEEIKTLPIKDKAADDCVLFFWVTNPLLESAFSVLESWGFEYKTNMVWIKDSATAGFYVRGQHELLLIATKGSLLPSGDLPTSIITGANEQHSRKPASVYEIIELMFPGGKYLELFARNTREGWVSWGNEIDVQG